MKGKNAKAEISRDGDNCVAAMVRTSGTTGKPKSVMLTNKGAISLVEQYKTTDLNLKMEKKDHLQMEALKYPQKVGKV